MSKGIVKMCLKSSLHLEESETPFYEVTQLSSNTAGMKFLEMTFVCLGGCVFLLLIPK